MPYYPPATAGLTNPMTNVGDLIRGGTAGAPTRLADVAVGSFLASGGVNTAPAYALAPATLLDYGELTTDLIVTGANSGAATAVCTGAGYTADGTTVVEILFTCGMASAAANNGDRLSVGVYKDGTLLETIAIIQNTTNAADLYVPLAGRCKDTPSAGAHTYSVKAWWTGHTNALMIATGITPMKMTVRKLS